MKKFTQILILLFLLLAYIPVAKCQEVYCVNVDAKNYTFSASFDPNKTDDENCKTWREEESKKISPFAYKYCMEDHKLLRAAYNNGQCGNVFEKKHDFGTTTCTIKLCYKYKAITSKSCMGQEVEKYIKELNYLYPDFK